MVVDGRERRSFLRTLLGGGVSAVGVHTMPSEQAADPVRVPAWRRIARLAGVGEAPVGTVDGTARLAGLSRRAARYLLFVPVAFRLLVLPVPLFVLTGWYGTARLAPVLGLAVVLGALNILMIVLMLNRPVADLRPLLAVDALAALTANVVAAATVPGSLDTAYHDVFWTYLVGTVMLWTAAWGPVASLVPLGLSVPTQAAMVRLNAATPNPVAGAIGRFLWLILALLVTALVIALIGLGIRLALAIGIRAGRLDERARLVRSIHDTVLPTLEAMALRSGEQARPADALAEVRTMARRQAALLRRTLGDLTELRDQGLAGELADAAAEAADLDVELVVADMDDRGLAAPRRWALRDAVRESLRNVAKHADCRRAVVRLDEADGGIRVVVRDHGAGFEATVERFGFGITESIMSRLREVGGQARVESRPGNGTRITLWVPR